MVGQGSRGESKSSKDRNTLKSVNERMTSQSLIDQNVTVDDGHFYEQSSGDELTISQHNV